MSCLVLWFIYVFMSSSLFLSFGLYILHGAPSNFWFDPFPLVFLLYSCRVYDIKHLGDFSLLNFPKHYSSLPNHTYFIYTLLYFYSNNLTKVGVCPPLHSSITDDPKRVNGRKYHCNHLTKYQIGFVFYPQPCIWGIHNTLISPFPNSVSNDSTS